MDRREALKNVAIILGGTIISSQAFLAGCRAGNKTSGSGIQFSDSDIDLLDEIAETIIPATDTLGAKAAGVGSFMAMMVPDCYREQNQNSFREGIGKIRNNFNREFSYSFVEAESEEREQFLNDLDNKIHAYNQTKKVGDPEHYFRIMKELTLLGYFTSEAGCKQARRYRQTPGRYEACLDYSKGAKAWSMP